MSAWISLTKKELRLGLPVFLIPVIAFILIAALAFYIGNRSGYGWESLAGFAMFATGAQVLYLVYYLLYSLSSEKKKLHLWLHNPMSGGALLFAKVVAGLISMTITLFLTGATLLISYQMSPLIQGHIQMISIFDLTFFAGIHLFLFALSIAAYFLFFWMIFLMFTRRLGTFLSLLSTFVIFIVASILYGWFTDSVIYQTLTNWGTFQLDTLQGINFTIDNNGAEVITDAATFSLYTGVYLFETLITLLLFFVASWLLDNKVEV